MRYTHPQAEMSPNGFYTGIGMRSAPETWARPQKRMAPRMSGLPAPGIEAPRRTTRSVMAPTPIYIRICMTFGLLLGLGVLIGFAMSLWRALF